MAQEEGEELVLRTVSAVRAVPADVASAAGEQQSPGQQNAAGELLHGSTLNANKSASSSEDDRGRSRHRRRRARRARRREHAHSSRRSDSGEPRTRSREKKRKRNRSNSRSDAGRDGSSDGGEGGGGGAASSKRSNRDSGPGGKQGESGSDRQQQQQDQDQGKSQDTGPGSQTDNRTRHQGSNGGSSRQYAVQTTDAVQDKVRAHRGSPAAVIAPAIDAAQPRQHHLEHRSCVSQPANSLAEDQNDPKHAQQKPAYDVDNKSSRGDYRDKNRDRDRDRDRAGSQGAEHDAVCRYRQRRSTSRSPTARHRSSSHRHRSRSPGRLRAIPPGPRRSRSPANSRRSRSPPAGIRSPARRRSQSPGFRNNRRPATEVSPSPDRYQENRKKVEPPADRDSRVPSEPAAPEVRQGSMKASNRHTTHSSPAKRASKSPGVASPKGVHSNGAVAAASKAPTDTAAGPTHVAKGALKPAVKLSFEDDMDVAEIVTAPPHAPGGITHVNGSRPAGKHHSAVVTPASKANPAIVRAVMAGAAPASLLLNHTRSSNSTGVYGLDGVDLQLQAAISKLTGNTLLKPVGPAYGLVAPRKSGNIVIAGEEGSSSSGLNVSSDELSSGADNKVPAGKLGRVVFGVAQARCGRPYMEDRHCCVSCWRPISVTGKPIEDGVERSYVGLFDGHNGDRCAQAAATRLHMLLACDPVFRTHTGELGPPASMAAEETAIASALRRAFQTLDEQVLKEAAEDGGRDGSTALVLLRLADTLYVAHLGDSRAALCRPRGVAQPLTKDHKPDLPAERARVEAAGGRIELQRCWRVIVEATRTRPGSGLAVSRSLGDIDFKRPLKLVDSTPDVSRYVPKPGDSFVVMASDGLWDVLSDQEAVDVVFNTLQRYKGVLNTAHATAAAEAALQLAVQRGTLDNVTVIVVILPWGSAM